MLNIHWLLSIGSWFPYISALIVAYVIIKNVLLNFYIIEEFNFFFFVYYRLRCCCSYVSIVGNVIITVTKTFEATIYDWDDRSSLKIWLLHLLIPLEGMFLNSWGSLEFLTYYLVWCLRMLTYLVWISWLISHDLKSSLFLLLLYSRNTAQLTYIQRRRIFKIWLNINSFCTTLIFWVRSF